MKKGIKAEKLISDEKIFLLYKGLFNEHYVVKGSTGEVYDVMFNIMKNTYTCSCGNVRTTDCYHIVGVKSFKGE